ncbi:MAG: tetratricopeptide repeat protein [Hyphomicrobiales bacterium]
MADDRVHRRLAAIVVADIVGYSLMMGRDEAGTLERLKSLRAEFLYPKVAEHGGRVVKTSGDGALIEFASAVEAVSNAVDLQRAMAERNAGLPEDQRIELRLGINVGDIIIDGDDIYGDGVNVAARLEALAEPGGIRVSGRTYEYVRGRLDIEFDDLGEQSLKNIEEPIHVFRVRNGDGSEATRGNESRDRLPLPEKPSLAVLPFENISGDREQEYFADGITEDIITSLSKLGQLMIIARHSSFTYKGQAIRVQQVGKELGVAFVIEGSVRKAANRVRIAAQLIDCATGGHLWAERYDRELTDIFAVQDEVTSEIVAAMKLTLTPDDQRRIRIIGTDNLEAYDCFLRAREQWWRLTREANENAEVMLRRAIELDPGFAKAFAWLSYVRCLEHMSGWHDATDQPLNECHDLAKKAVELDGTDADAHNALGCAQLWLGNHEFAASEYETAIALDPNNARAHAELGWVYYYAGRSMEAVEPVYHAMRLDPQYPDAYLLYLAQPLMRLHRFDEAVRLLKRRIIRKPDTDISRVLLASCYGYLGRPADAKLQWADALSVNPDFSLEQRRRVLPYKDPADFDFIVDGLQKAGLPD